MSKHATLSASGSHRWLACPPSVLLEAREPETASEYAAEGTAAHELAERRLALALGKTSKGAYTRWYKTFRAGCEWCNPAFEDDVAKYVGMVMEVVAERGAPFVDLEQRVDFSEWVPGGFGTADVVILGMEAEGGSDTLQVIDLKFGKGVPVSAERNTQLMLYALGAAEKYALAYAFDKVAMTIIQPRLDSSSTYILPYRELLYWAENTVKPRAALAIAGKGEFGPSDESCRFCKVRAKCKARAEQQMGFAKLEFAEKAPELLTAEEVAILLTTAPGFASWLSDVQGYALEQARDHGERYPGWKLVEGRSNRIITDAGAAIAALRTNLIQEDKFMSQPQLLGITALEKNLGRGMFADILGAFVEKPAGKPVLVPESDNRPEMRSADSARADFE